MGIKELISFVCLILSILTIFISISVKIILKIKLKKTKKEDEKERITKKLELLDIIIPNAMAVAESSGVNNPTIKKTLALSNIIEQCTSKDISYSENKSFIDKKIEDLIDFSKEVNSKIVVTTKQNIFTEDVSKCPVCGLKNLTFNPKTLVYTCNDCSSTFVQKK